MFNDCSVKPSIRVLISLTGKVNKVGRVNAVLRNSRNKFSENKPSLVRCSKFWLVEQIIRTSLNILRSLLSIL